MFFQSLSKPSFTWGLYLDIREQEKWTLLITWTFSDICVFTLVITRRHTKRVTILKLFEWIRGITYVLWSIGIIHTCRNSCNSNPQYYITVSHIPHYFHKSRLVPYSLCDNFKNSLYRSCLAKFNWHPLQTHKLKN